MKLFKGKDFREFKNPSPGAVHRSDILDQEDAAKELGGMFALLEPGKHVPLHHHEKRESIIVIISGEAIEMIEGREFPIESGDVLYIPAGEKHALFNRSDHAVRYLEFFTYPPAEADFILDER
jgi:mannose-6-phosphate isomerase-like protein (cupin superfamily)